MKAIICTTYGSPEVLQLREIEKPTPGDHDVLVRVYASTATTADTMMRRAEPFISRFFLGLTKPRHAVTGTGFAGVVEAVGSKVTRFKPGDKVFGETGTTFGANAEYVRLSEESVILKLPTRMRYEEAATMTDGPLTSYNFLTEVFKLEPGHRVLINGASGSLGTAAVQLAKAFGAHVTAVCGPSNADLVRSLGADAVIDYRKEDFTQRGEQYDVIFDTVGKRSFGDCKQALKPEGVYISPVLRFSLLLRMLWTSKFGKQKARFSATGLQPAPQLRAMLDTLKGIFEADKLKVVIDRRYPLEQTAEAHRYVDSGHKKGNVVILVA